VASNYPVPASKYRDDPWNLFSVADVLLTEAVTQFPFLNNRQQ
ncbi:uncharacterized protein METZ01_LOCUS142030, partial [marine metagenome]